MKGIETKTMATKKKKFQQDKIVLCQGKKATPEANFVSMENEALKYQ